MMKIMKRPAIWSIIFLTVVFIAVGIANIPTDKWFIGWDALNPEFNYGINFSRVFTAFWQENQGLGLLGGHGFAAVLPHVIITYLLNFFMPDQAVRFVFTFLTLYLGMIGAYFLAKLLIQKSLPNTHQLLLTEASASIAGLYYMLNFGTVQMYYIQLEAFAVHFTGLPWLLYAFIRYLDAPGKKTLAALAAVSFLSSAQGFIPPLFVAAFVSLLFISFSFLWYHRNRLNLKRILFALFTVIFANAYYLVPLAYYTMTRSSIYLNSYNNIISTPEFLDKNKKYGDLINVPLARGFVYDALDAVREGVPVYVFQPWRNHFSNPLVPAIGYTVFILASLGLVIAIKKRMSYLAPGLAGVALFFFTGITTDFPPFSFITAALQYVPVYRQAFRAAFTKFSIGLGLGYSLFLALGIIIFSQYLYRKFKHRIFITAPSIIIGLSILFYALPAFQGQYIYRRLIKDIPNAYFQIIDYFKKAPDGRIANLPQDCSEGWTNYNWGYTGSGFWWYGIKQPILDRAFDVWSNYNENYFWELRYLLRARRFDDLEKLFSKYDVTWILYDPNVFHCKNAKGFMQFPELITYFNNHPDYYRLTKNFTSDGIAPISLYERIKIKSKSYVSITPTLPNIGPKTLWNDYDQALMDYGMYQTATEKPINVYYPFPSLFSGRGTSFNDFIVTEDGSDILISNIITDSLTGSDLLVPDYDVLERFIPAELIFSSSGQNKKTVSSQATVKYLYPQLYVDDKHIPQNDPRVSVSLNLKPTEENEVIKISINGAEFESQIPVAGKTVTHPVVLYGNAINRLRIYSKDSVVIGDMDLPPVNKSRNLSFSKIPIQTNPSRLTVRIPKINIQNAGSDFTPTIRNATVYPCNEIVPSNRNAYEFIGSDTDGYLKLTSTQSRQCVSFSHENIDHATGNIVGIEYRNTVGRTPSFYITNHLTEVADLDVYLPPAPNFRTFYFMLPPTYPYAAGRTVYFDSYSLRSSPTINDLKRLTVWQVPYWYLKEIRFLKNPIIPVSISPIADVTRKNETHYEILINNVDEEKMIILNQAYAPEWHAYLVQKPTDNSILSTMNYELSTRFPHFFAPRLKEHVLVNNWANGWRLPTTHNSQPTTIVIFFTPQLLQWIGFALLPLPFLIILLKRNPESRVERPGDFQEEFIRRVTVSRLQSRNG